MTGSMQELVLQHVVVLFPCAGHYVVISGYDAPEDCFTVCDPALTIGQVKMPSAVLDLARSAFGTDEDLLIVPKPCLATCAENHLIAARDYLIQQPVKVLAALGEDLRHTAEPSISALLC